MDISSLRERSDKAFSVTELNMMIKNMFESNRLLSSIHVRGEISNFVNHRSGHLYFSLKDEDGQIRSVMFRSSAIKLKFIPENGMKVTVYGSITTFPRDGSYQIYVTSMQPDGIGTLYLAYEQLKAKLDSEGMFDEFYKKPIPRFPKRIGVVTSPTGAAVRDIINVLGRRYPLATVYLYPALVQGDGAEESLIKGIDYFDKSGLVDTVIIGRGGGSIEDLWAFNSESLARRIFECKIPVISAVGHETDFTICDFVSDLRAPTPSAAAELSVPDVRDLTMQTMVLSDRCERALIRTTDRMRDRLKSVLSRKIILQPEDIVSERRDRAEALASALNSAYSARISSAKYSFGELIAELEALNPLSVLVRGYSVVEKEGVSIKSISDLSVGDSLDVRLSDGRISVTVGGMTSADKEDGYG